MISTRSVCDFDEKLIIYYFGLQGTLLDVVLTVVCFSWFSCLNDVCFRRLLKAPDPAVPVQ